MEVLVTEPVTVRHTLYTEGHYEFHKRRFPIISCEVWTRRRREGVPNYKYEHRCTDRNTKSRDFIPCPRLFPTVINLITLKGSVFALNKSRCTNDRRVTESVGEPFETPTPKFIYLHQKQSVGDWKRPPWQLRPEINRRQLTVFHLGEKFSSSRIDDNWWS